MTHFILHCVQLRNIRNKILLETVDVLNSLGIQFNELLDSEKLQIILDITPVATTKKLSPASVAKVERLTRRLIYQLHIARYKIVCG